MLVAQHVGWQPTEPNTVYPGGRPASPPPDIQTYQGPVPPAALPAGGIVVFTRIWYKPPGWGACPVGGVVHSGAVATVAPWRPERPPGHADGEEWAPHAETGLGDDDTPWQPARGWSPRQRAKLLPAQAGPGKRCWWSAAPSGAALTGGMRSRGAPGPMTAPDLRSSRLRLRIRQGGPGS